LLMTVCVWLVAVNRQYSRVQYLVQWVDSIFCQTDGNALAVRVWLSHGARIQTRWNQEDSPSQEHAREIHRGICDRGKVASDGSLWPGDDDPSFIVLTETKFRDVLRQDWPKVVTCLWCWIHSVLKGANKVMNAHGH
jgi:hypothetical protein